MLIDVERLDEQFYNVIEILINLRKLEKCHLIYTGVKQSREEMTRQLLGTLGQGSAII